MNNGAKTEFPWQLRLRSLSPEVARRLNDIGTALGNLTAIVQKDIAPDRHDAVRDAAQKVYDDALAVILCD
jgi:hypothetical protein